VAKKALQKVDPAEEPSAEWGWHGSFPVAGPVAGVASILVLLAMLVGNHEGRIENMYLIGIAALIALGLVLHFVKRRNAWRR
jgi:hypothetical protein